MTTGWTPVAGASDGGGVSGIEDVPGLADALAALNTGLDSKIGVSYERSLGLVSSSTFKELPGLKDLVAVNQIWMFIYRWTNYGGNELYETYQLGRIAASGSALYTTSRHIDTTPVSNDTTLNSEQMLRIGWNYSSEEFEVRTYSGYTYTCDNVIFTAIRLS